MRKLDLHIHSWHSSDGELAVAEIIDIAKAKGLNTIAVTDHNCARGVPEALSYGNQTGVNVIPGIELDCVYQDVNLHLLGYHIDWKLQEFETLACDMEAQELRVLPRMVHNLRLIGIVDSEDEVLRQAEGKPPSAEMIAEILLHQPAAYSNPQLRPYLPGGQRSDKPYLNFYRDFLAPRKSAHVPQEYMRLEEAVSLVRHSGGVAVLAHPGDNLRTRLELLDDIIRVGVDGLEVFSNYHTDEQIAFFHRKAKEKNVLITCGSDFHGKNKPGIHIGDSRCPQEVDGLWPETESDWIRK